MYLTNLFHSIQIGKRSSSAQKSIEIDSYEVTIFPAETVKNTQTLPALSKMKKQLNSANKGDEPTYHTWFYDLHGGRTEYVITIACMIGRSRSERQNQNAKNISKRAEILSVYSGDPKTGRVRFSNGTKLSGYEMVRFSNAI